MVIEIQSCLDSGSLPKLRKAAKLVRAECNRDHCTSLLTRLESIVGQERHWETSCEVIETLGICRFLASLDLIERLWRDGEEHSALTHTAASAYVRLTREDLCDAAPVIRVLHEGGYSAREGALNALGNDRMVPPNAQIVEIIALCWDLGSDRNRPGYGDPRCGLAAACAGWLQADAVHEFLQHCLETGDAPLRQIAGRSLKGIYTRRN